MNSHLPKSIRRYLEAQKYFVAARDLKVTIQKSLRQSKITDRRIASLAPNESPRGFALLSYILDAFFLKRGLLT